MHQDLLVFISLWLIYGFLGFIVETTYVSVLQKKFVQRGFLSGPIIPIYAFGAMIILLFLKGYTNVFVVFILGMILTSILEYIGHYLMEKLLHLKLWDYSERFMNINGRICLLNSTLFGILAVSLVFFINPPIERFLYNMNITVLTTLTTLGVLITASDFTFSLLAALNIKAHLKELSETELKFDTEQFKEHFNNMELKYKSVKKRLIKSYPDIDSVKFSESFKDFKKRYKENYKESTSIKGGSLE